jgi:hypothetical protein
LIAQHRVAGTGLALHQRLATRVAEGNDTVESGSELRRSQLELQVVAFLALPFPFIDLSSLFDAAIEDGGRGCQLADVGRRHQFRKIVNVQEDGIRMGASTRYRFAQLDGLFVNSKREIRRRVLGNSKKKSRWHALADQRQLKRSIAPAAKREKPFDAGIGGQRQTVDMRLAAA